MLAEVCIGATVRTVRRSRAASVVIALSAAICVVVVATPRAGATGRIVGRVRLVKAVSGRPVSTSYSSRTITPQAESPKEIRNVVVYLQGMGAERMTPKHRQLRQEGELFLPHVLPVGVGDVVDFTNEDPFYHNVFSLSRAGTFDLGRFPRGESRTRTFGRPGLVKVFCHLHSDMSAVVMVFDHPWFTTPALDGGFVIDDVPAGRHSVAAWHERVGEAHQTVEVSAGEDATVEFALPVVEP